jgi:hypothetical protein
MIQAARYHGTKLDVNEFGHAPGAGGAYCGGAVTMGAVPAFGVARGANSLAPFASVQ